MRLKESVIENLTMSLGVNLTEQVEIALEVDSPELLEDFLRWQKVRLMSQSYKENEVMQRFSELHKSVITHRDIKTSRKIEDFINKAIANLERPSPREELPKADLQELSKTYTNELLAGRRDEAMKLITNAVEGGIDMKDIYLHVFQYSLYEVGRLWQMNQVSIAQEHYFSAATQVIMSRLSPFIFSGEKIGKRLVAAGVENNLHDIGIRMIADFFEMNGWDTYFLGGNTPAEAILQAIKERDPHLVALSVSVSKQIGAAKQIIRAIRKNSEHRNLKIIIGGHPFNIAPDLWKKIGSDGYAKGAEEAVRLAEKMFRVDQQ